MEKTAEINNAFYDEYGEKWYSAFDDPVALLRAENKVKFPWIMNNLREFQSADCKILDVGCGGGLLSNELAKQGYRVTGIDLSPESLRVAKKYDATRNVHYEVADAYHLPFADGCFDAVTSMDFLEHVERPEDVIKECSRVLKPNGLFFFHTFNRNPLSHLVIIKFLEWFIKNTPKNMHVIDLFIKPKEMQEYCRQEGLEMKSMIGLRPEFTSIDWAMIKTGVVSKNMRFRLTKSTLLSYMGMAEKL